MTNELYKIFGNRIGYTLWRWNVTTVEELKEHVVKHPYDNKARCGIGPWTGIGDVSYKKIEEYLREEV